MAEAACRWRRRQILGALFGLLSGRLCAAATPAAQPQLLRIARAGASGWLLGSVHAGVPDMYPLPAALEEALARAPLLALELALDRLDEGALERAVDRHALLPDDADLRSVLGASLWQRLERTVLRLGTGPLARFDRYRPWYAAHTLGLTALEQAGFRMHDGVDAYLTRRARARGTPVVGLETLEEQFSALGAMTRADEVAFLSETLESLAHAPAQMAELLGAWRRGDVAVAERLILDALRAQAGDETYRRLITVRNVRMAERMALLLNGPDAAFVAIGLGHVVGPGSVPGELVRRGFRVEAVTHAGVAASLRRPRPATRAA